LVRVVIPKRAFWRKIWKNFKLGSFWGLVVGATIGRKTFYILWDKTKQQRKAPFKGQKGPKGKKPQIFWRF